MEEIKRVLTGKRESREQSRRKAHFGISDKSAWRTEIESFLIKSSPTNVKLSIETFMEQIETMFKEKQEFDYRDESISFEHLEQSES